MVLQAKKLRDMSSEIYGAIDGVKTRAIRYVDKLDKKDGLVKEKLRIVNIKEG